VVTVGFAALILLGTILLLLPEASAAGTVTAPLTALFTATSAVCVTGLTVVSTATHWSPFGQVVILALIQLGGLGIVTFASLLGALVFRRFGLRMRLSAQTETKSLELGRMQGVLFRVVLVSLVSEAVAALLLTIRLTVHYGYPPGRATYLGVFHAVSAFNHAGFALFGDSVQRFAQDPWISLTLISAVVLGGLGYPVVIELWRLRRRTGKLSLHAEVTLLVTGVLLVLGPAAVTAAEWSNPATLGRFSVPGKLLAGFFTGVMPRSAGFTAVDIGGMHPVTLVITDVLMFIGGGSASTAGGIKVTTFALLAFVMIAEVRGEPTVHVLGRRLSAAVQRQALTVALLAVGAIVLATVILLVLTPYTLDEVLFEAISAFGTVGLSTGITTHIPGAGLVVLVLLMFLGRLGPVTLGSALALRDRPRRYELPEERPIVG
jgi:potassium uptake TrkH family protein